MNTKGSVHKAVVGGSLRTAFLLFTCLILAAFVMPVSAASALDGEGTMSVEPSHMTYGSTVGTFTFTFTANSGDFGPGSQVALTIPAGWTVPTTAAGAGHISVQTGTCTLQADPLGINGSVIFVDMVSCTSGQFFTITYSGAAVPSPAGSPYTFLTQTDIGPGGEGLVTITAGSPTVTIDPAVLIVSAAGLTPHDKVYDGTAIATLDIGTPTLIGVLGSDSVSLSTIGATGVFSDKHVGMGKVVTITELTLFGPESDYYTLMPPTRTANITKKSLSVTALTENRVYNGTTSSSGVPTLSTTLGSGDSADFVQSFDTKNAGTGKTITPSGTVNDGNSGLNYTYTFNPVTNGVITVRPITVQAVADSKPYDGATSSGATPILSGGTSLGAGDTAIWTQAFDTKDVGTGKTLTPAGSVTDGNGGLNYIYTYLPVSTGVITAKPITVTAEAKSKTYGADDPQLTYTVSPALISGDSLAGNLTRAPGNAVGTYAIQQGTLDHPNYAISYTGANLIITKAILTVTADHQTINTGEIDPFFGFAYSGFMYGETPIVIDTDPVCEVFVEHIAPGKYPITCSGGLDDNYGFTFVSGTLTVTAIPTLLTPDVDGHLLSNAAVVFDWVEIPTAKSYTIQIASNNTFKTLLFNKNIAAPVSLYQVNLPANKTLFWRVRSSGSYGTSAWAESRSFMTANPPSIPALVSPAANALVTIHNPTLHWNNSTLPKNTAFGRYRVQVATDSTFTTGLREFTTNETVIDDSSIMITPDLLANTKYFWRVRSENSLDQYSAWSTTRYFRVALLPLTLDALPNGDLPSSLRPTFTWTDPNLTAPLATSYTIQVATSSTFSTIVYTGTAPAGATSHIPSKNLPAGKPLHWRMRANGANGPSLWVSRSFTSPTPPSVPVLLLPANNALNKNYTPTLKWRAVKATASTTFDHYQVQVDDDRLFGSPIVDDISLTLSSQTQLTTPPLPHNTRFYWRVLAYNNLGQYSISAVRSFRTVVDAPILSTPAHNTTGLTLNPTFEWEDATLPFTSYTIQISTSSSFGTLLVNATTKVSSYTRSTNFPAGKKLYWRVRVNGENGPSAWSTVFSFTTP